MIMDVNADKTYNHDDSKIDEKLNEPYFTHYFHLQHLVFLKTI
ncbi:hypothetical protein [Rossellomorea aquimaris]|nr:hypothetical protein [Rossellomorea aquimaris]